MDLKAAIKKVAVSIFTEINNAMVKYNKFISKLYI